MDVSVTLIIGIVVVLAAIIWYFRSAKKAKHRLDDLHITAEGKKKD